MRSRGHVGSKAGKKKNEPPAGAGKGGSASKGQPKKLSKRSEVVQAQRGHAELNLGPSSDEPASVGRRSRRSEGS